MSSGSTPVRPKRRAASANISYKEPTEAEAFASLANDSQQSAKRQKKTSSSHNKSQLTSNGNGSGGAVLNSHGRASNSRGSSTGTSDCMGLENFDLLLSDKSDGNPIPWNWQPPFKPEDYFSNHLDLKNAKVDKNITLTTKDGFKLSKNDYIYMVSEPPGEPYYIARVLGFTKKDKNLTTKNASNYMLKVNWFYRPRDLNQKSSDSRLVYATMHLDNCPLQSFRGLVTLQHRSEITDLDLYKQLPNHFYFDKLFDRYMLKYYEVLPTVNLVNLPTNYYQLLNKRFQYVFVEVGRGKDLLSAPKNCEKCFQWCSSMDSVMCINCERHYHMLCLDPPLLKKPQRGFGWSCALCNKKLESKMSKERGEMLTTSSLAKINSSRNGSVGVEEEEEEEDLVPPEEDTQPTKEETPEDDSINPLPRYEELAIQFLEKDKDLSVKQRRNLEEWPYRYLGMHVKLEDALDLQDRPYARSASRLGSKHQLTGLQEWLGHPMQYYDPDESMLAQQQQLNHSKKKKSSKKKASPSPALDPDTTNLKKLPVPELFANVDPADFPPWLQERPLGYIERGGPDTATLMWKMPEGLDKVELVEQYITRCSSIAKDLSILPYTPNFLDAILKNLLDSKYDTDVAYKESTKLSRDSLKEPTLTPEEIAKFEEAVKIHGSELYPVYKHVGTKSSADIVRFYYLWKKTPNGHKIWDNYEGRTKNKLKNADKLANSAVDSVADSGDDSGYDSNKIAKAKRTCECKNCHTTTSVHWFRVTGHNKAPQDPTLPMVGLCLRCAKLWRRYAIQWEEPTEVFKKNLQRGGGVGWKKRIEAELLADAEAIIAARNKAAANGIPLPKKAKISTSSPKKEPQSQSPAPQTLQVKLNLKKPSASSSSDKTKKKEALKAKPVVKKPSPSPPPSPLPVVKKSFKLAPPPQILYLEHHPDYLYDKSPVKIEAAPVSIKTESGACAVCHSSDNNTSILTCSNCKIQVHKLCYGVNNKRLTSSEVWSCDCCMNDLNPIYSTNYSCSLCVTRSSPTVTDLLKPTVEGEWCHVLCALFESRCRFGNLNSNSQIHNAPAALRNDQSSTICTICKYNEGSVTKCEMCDDHFHPTCVTTCLPQAFLGFVMEECAPKDKKCMKIQDFVQGKPKPTIVCDKHFANQPLPPQFVPMRVPGRRMNFHAKSGSQEQPLIGLYIQDCKKFGESDHLSVDTTSLVAPPIVNRQSCDECNSSKSIIFLKHEEKLLCHSCYSSKTNENYLIERENYTAYAKNAMSLMNLLHSPLPTERKPEEKGFQKIRINDILS